MLNFMKSCYWVDLNLFWMSVSWDLWYSYMNTLSLTCFNGYLSRVSDTIAKIPLKQILLIKKGSVLKIIQIFHFSIVNYNTDLLWRINWYRKFFVGAFITMKEKKIIDSSIILHIKFQNKEYHITHWSLFSLMERTVYVSLFTQITDAGFHFLKPRTFVINLSYIIHMW